MYTSAKKLRVMAFSAFLQNMPEGQFSGVTARSVGSCPCHEGHVPRPHLRTSCKPTGFRSDSILLSLASRTAEGVSYASRKPTMVFLMTVPPVVRLQ